MIIYECLPRLIKLQYITFSFVPSTNVPYLEHFLVIRKNALNIISEFSISHVIFLIEQNPKGMPISMWALFRKKECC